MKERERERGREGGKRGEREREGGGGRRKEGEEFFSKLVFLIFVFATFSR